MHWGSLKDIVLLFCHCRSQTSCSLILFRIDVRMALEKLSVGHEPASELKDDADDLARFGKTAQLKVCGMLLEDSRTLTLDTLRSASSASCR